MAYLTETNRQAGVEEEGLNGGWGGGPLVGCRLKFSHFVGSRLKFSIFVGFGKSQLIIKNAC